MKKIFIPLIILGVIALVFGLFSNQTLAGFDSILYHSPCEAPVRYRAGSIDARFGLTEQELLSDVRQAEAYWETSAKRDLFVYDPEAELVINLEYDKRQDLNNEIEDLRSEVEEQKDSLKPEIAAYEERSLRFQERATNLNNEIAKWNSQGGAPAEVFDRLENEQASLQQEAAALSAEAKRLNLSSDSFAAKVDQLNNTVTDFNSELAVRPEEGLYDPNTNTISIYFHSNKDEFIHTLAHELGHARGIGHVENENAIMYAQVNQQVVPAADDLAALREVCAKKSYFEIIGERVRLLLQLYSKK